MATNEEALKEVTIYTDGGCTSNPGPGGYGVVLIHGKFRRELSGGYRLTTNNRMELMAAIEGLKALEEPCEVKLYSDSRYVVNGMRLGWAKKWRENDWWRTKSEKVLNPDLWDQLLTQCEKHEVEFVWVRGHAGDRENERCDALSYRAAMRADLPEDEGYDPNVKTGKVRITQEGDLCRKCSTAVIKKTPKRRKIKRKQTYFYEYYFYCPNCDTIYKVEEAKREIEEEPPEQLSFF